MREALERAKSNDSVSGATGRDPNAAENKVGERQQDEDPENRDASEPLQLHFVKILPPSAGGLNEDARLWIHDVDAPFDTR